MDTQPPTKSFEDLIARAKQEPVPEVNVRLNVRLALMTDMANQSIFGYLGSLATPRLATTGLAVLMLTMTLAGVQVYNSIHSLDEVALVTSVLGF